MNKERQHYEESTTIPSPPEEVFGYVDDHSRFSAHMNKSSFMLGGGRMKVQIDNDQGQKVGSHIQMTGKVLGINLSLDEVITKYEPPRLKVWETVGSPKLLVIGPYQMGLEITPDNSGSSLKVFINYELPTSNTRWLGHLFGSMYAKWCVKQMLKGAQEYFKKNK